MGWTPTQLPDQSGKTTIITGGNSGLGLEAARILAGKHARVVITSRSAGKAQEAIALIRQTVPDASIDFVVLDLADAASVTAAAAALRGLCPRIDAIVNNAGVMQPPETRTGEGYELQMATNHLGHFRLNALLLDVVEASGGRFVPVSSIAHKMGKIQLDDLQSTHGYDAMTAYAQSKLANLLYGFELQRRLAARGSKATSIPCHPGYAATNLQSTGVGMDGGSAFWRLFYKFSNAVMAQSAEAGAYPLVLAAADPTARPGAYYGPTGLQQTRGPVGESFVADVAKDEAVARGLWEKTEALMGPFFPPPG